MGIESSDMTEDEIQALRPCVYKTVALQASGPLFFKIHDAYTFVYRRLPLIPADATRCAIYIVRNPLDVAISFAHHAAVTLDESIERMSNEAFAFSSSPERLHRHLKQKLLSWSGHVLSWLDQDAISVHLVRYEDMHGEAQKTLTDMLCFLEMNPSAHRVRRALEFSAFGVLREQESAFGFREAPAGAKSFFRSGRVGEWRDVLTSSQVDRVVTDHGAVMRRLGYIDSDGGIR